VWSSVCHLPSIGCKNSRWIQREENVADPLTFFYFSFANSICHAKHVRDKAAKWAKAKRPRKSRPSDINRTPIVYEIHSYAKPAEYSISDAAASLAPKPAVVSEN
jgi:hypothetical protein